jgi:hypothetical protein
MQPAVYTDPTGVPHVLVRGRRVLPRQGRGRLAVSGRMRSASYGTDVSTVYPTSITPGATPVVSGLGDDISSWGDITDKDGTSTLVAPFTTVAGAVVGGLIFSSIAKKGWLGMLAGAGFGYLASALGRDNRRLKTEAGPAGTASK